MKEKTFTIKGDQIKLSRNKVTSSIKGHVPEKIRRYYVSIEGKHYPIKQVLEAATNLPSAAFTTNYSYTILNSLGFEIKEESGYVCPDCGQKFKSGMSEKLLEVAIHVHDTTSDKHKLALKKKKRE